MPEVSDPHLRLAYGSISQWPTGISLVLCQGKVHTVSVFPPGSQQQVITTLLPVQMNATFHVNV